MPDWETLLEELQDYPSAMTVTTPRHGVFCVPKSAPLSAVPLRAIAERPVISVVIPSYNQGRFIQATLESILRQDYRPLEILVMDGASTDDTLRVLESYRASSEVKIVSEPDSGIVEAVNKGFDRAKGDIVAIQSSDDCYLPGALRRVVDEFRSDAAVGLVYGDTVKVDAEGYETLRYRIGPYSLENLFLLRTWIPQPSAFFRRELLEAVGGWDERIPYAPDTDLWIRMAFRTEVRKIDEYLSQRRVHDEQRDTQVRKIVRDYTQMIEQSPDIGQAPNAVRSAAHAGKYLIRLRYNATKSDWYAGWNLLRAGIADRRCLDVKAIARCFLYAPLRNQLSRIKRGLAPARI